MIGLEFYGKIISTPIKSDSRKMTIAAPILKTVALFFSDRVEEIFERFRIFEAHPGSEEPPGADGGAIRLHP